MKNHAARAADGRVVPGGDARRRAGEAVFVSASAFVGFAAAFGVRAGLAGAAFTAIGAGLGWVPVGPRRRAAASTTSVRMAIVPWGVLIEEERQPRVLRWAAIRAVRVEMTYARDQASDSTRSSVVTVDTGRERFVARASGAVPLERLLAHLDAYARESSRAIAFDLDGARAGDGPIEPDCEPLLRAARGYVDSAPASIRLGLEGGSYRTTPIPSPSPVALSELGRVLRDRDEKGADPRPFAAIVAAELGARDLAEEVVALVQSPHPIVAAVAKAAALRLGVASARTGTLDEVAPFLLDEDRHALEAWSAARL